MTKVQNNGRETAYLPTDGGTLALEPGDTSGDLRLGDADYAVRSVPGVVFVDDAITVQGITKASTDPAVVPISKHEAAHPEDVRYAVVGDAVATPGAVKVVPGPVIVPGTTDGATPEQLVGAEADEAAARAAADQAAAEAAVAAEADAAAAKRSSRTTTPAK